MDHGLLTQVPDLWKKRGRRHPLVGIFIDPTGTTALKACLPSSVYARFETQALRPPDGVQVFTEDLRVLATLPPALLTGSRPITRLCSERCCVATQNTQRR